MAKRSIIGSSEDGPCNVVQILDQRDFSGIMEDTQLTTASSRRDLNIDQNWIDELRISEIIEDDDFSVLKLNYNRHPQSHYKHFSHRQLLQNPKNFAKRFLVWQDPELCNASYDFSWAISTLSTTAPFTTTKQILEKNWLWSHSG